MLANDYPDFFYTDDGTRIFYRTNFHQEEMQEGSPLLVFVYGLLCNNMHWLFQLPYFDNLGYNILIHDLRGHFSSSGKEYIESCTFENFAKDLRELLKKIGSKNIVLLGHSMGVNIALEYANRFPEDVKGMILISGSVTPPQDIMFNSNIADISFPLIKALSKAFPAPTKMLWKNSYLNPIARKIVHSGGFNINTVSDDFVSGYMKKIGELPHELFFQLMEQMRDHDIINHLESIKTPALVMGGDNDQVIPNKSQYIISKLMPNSELYIIRDGSHVPQADFPDTINDRINKFIESLKYTRKSPR